MLNLPPDRTMYGRAFWTYMHTVSVYLPHTPTPDQLAAFKGELRRDEPRAASGERRAEPARRKLGRTPAPASRKERGGGGTRQLQAAMRRAAG